METTAVAGHSLSVVSGGRELRLPTVIEQAGERARRRFVEFFTAEIRNPHTRRAYGSAAGRFLRWCEVVVDPYLNTARHEQAVYDQRVTELDLKRNFERA